MRTFIEKQELVETISQLYPRGCTTVKEMIQRFKIEGIQDLGVTRVSLLTRDRGRNNFIVGYVATEYVNPQGEIISDSFGGDQILKHPVMELIKKDSGPVVELGRIDLNNHLNAGLIPGKISPMEIPRLGVRTYKKSRHFFISSQTIALAEMNVEAVVPKGEKGFEILSLQKMVEYLRLNLINRNWGQVHIA